MSNNLSPYVSVILPVYNCEKFIKETILSILNQTFSNFELIIVNDGSTDNTLQICNSFNDKRIKIITQKNYGVSIARNNGINVSKGRYIAFIDSDDIWLPKKIEKQVFHLENCKEVGISYCSSCFIDESGKLLKIYQIPKYKNITLEDLLCNNPIKNGSVPLVRKEALNEICYKENNNYFYFDPNVEPAEDFDCWLRIFLNTSWKIEGIPDCLVYYRINPYGGSSNIVKYSHSWKKIIKKNLSTNIFLLNKYNKLAESFLYRFLAQRIIWTKGDKLSAFKLIHKIFIADYKIILKDPITTFITFIGGYFYFLFPSKFYNKIELLGCKIVGVLQKIYKGVT